MISNTIPSLGDICATSILYRIWTHQNIYENWNEENQRKLLVNKVSSDVQSLPLPDLMKSLLLQLVKPVGTHFCVFLNGLLNNVGTSETWLTTGMLSDCLTLYVVGIINQRKTVKKLLKSKPLDSKIAFRLACVNYLEDEVLRLWPHVSQYFLNKIVLEYRDIHVEANECNDVIKNYHTGDTGYVQEPNDVLFWISYCLSKANGIDFHAVPVSFIDEIDPSFTHDFCCHKLVLYAVGSSGNTSFFDYIKNCSSPCALVRHEDEVLSHCSQWEINPVYFFYHFSKLDDERKKYLFNQIPVGLLSYFLQWPLSSLFLENIEGIWDLLVELNVMDLIFVKMIEILYGKNYSRCDLLRNGLSYYLSTVHTPYVYSKDHLERIWTALWNLCPTEIKSRIVDAFAFTESFKTFIRKASSKNQCNALTLTDDLQKLFLSHGEAFLLFLSQRNLKYGLEKVISKYMPEKRSNFRWVRLPQISNNTTYTLISSHAYFKEETYLRQNVNPLIRRRQKRLNAKFLNKLFKLMPSEEAPCFKLFEFSGVKSCIKQQFVDYIQEFLLSNNMKNSLLLNK